MGRRPDPKVPRIKSRKYALGYARACRGKWKIFIGSRRFLTPYRATMENADAVRAEIDRRFEQVEAEKAAAAAGVTPAPSLYAAVDMWYAEFIADNPRTMQSYRDSIRTALLAYSPEGQDMPLENSPACVERLARRMIDIRSRRSDADGTARRYLQTWKRIFTWCVAMGWIPRNPVAMMSLPTPPVKSDARRQYTPAELEAILAAADRINPEFRRLLDFLLLTGMRISEALGMKWEDVTPAGMKIFGKGQKGEKAVRYFPLREFDGGPLADWMEQIRRILNAQRGLPNGGYVWKWPKRHLATYVFDQVRDAVGIAKEGGRAFHTFRAMAEHRMQFDLGLPPAYTARLVGHSVTVAETRYKIIADADLMGDVLERLQDARNDERRRGDFEKELSEMLARNGQNIPE